MAHGRKIAVIGLGYVGLPVAIAFARTGVPVIGFDIDRRRVEERRSGYDKTREVNSADLTSKALRNRFPGDVRRSKSGCSIVPSMVNSSGECKIC
jgi:UDP-N-acetyl-D-mannosaminuronate dehydrogenase